MQFNFFVCLRCAVFGPSLHMTPVEFFRPIVHSHFPPFVTNSKICRCLKMHNFRIDGRIHGGRSIGVFDKSVRITWEKNVHPVELGRSTLRDLLDTKLTELSLQLIELLGEVVLALSPELSSLNLGARLYFIAKKRQVSTIRKIIRQRDSPSLAKEYICYVPFWRLRVVRREFVELEN